jgi:hypothetical protein
VPRHIVSNIGIIPREFRLSQRLNWLAVAESALDIEIVLESRVKIKGRKPTKTITAPNFGLNLATIIPNIAPATAAPNENSMAIHLLFSIF